MIDCCNCVENAHDFLHSSKWNVSNCYQKYRHNEINVVTLADQIIHQLEYPGIMSVKMPVKSRVKKFNKLKKKHSIRKASHKFFKKLKNFSSSGKESNDYWATVVNGKWFLDRLYGPDFGHYLFLHANFESCTCQWNQNCSQLFAKVNFDLFHCKYDFLVNLVKLVICRILCIIRQRLLPLVCRFGWSNECY